MNHSSNCGSLNQFKDKLGVRLFVGSQGGTLVNKTHDGREREDLEGDRCFTAAYPPMGAKVFNPDSQVTALLDSGAFTHKWDDRLTPEQALINQLTWEQKFSKRHGINWKCHAIASYDLLIDEVWIDGKKEKQRWSVERAEEAVNVTIDAARYLVSQEKYLGDRFLVLGAQGVNAEQYYRCLSSILEVSTEQSWIGFGGWCILGLPQFRHWLPEFYETLKLTIPAIAQSPVKHCHLYGCLYEPALAVFAWYCHQYKLTCSVDSSRPILDCKGHPKYLKKRGAKANYWRDNVKCYQNYCSNIYRSKYYRQPVIYQQLSLF